MKAYKFNHANLLFEHINLINIEGFLITQSIKALVQAEITELKADRSKNSCVGLPLRTTKIA